jgi:Tfp pilus assembly protein PilF
MGDVSEARDSYRQAVLVLTGVGADRSAADLWYEIASLWDDLGEVGEARDAYRRAAASTGLRARTRASRRAVSSTSRGRE